jgi:hypothetical protein
MEKGDTMQVTIWGPDLPGKGGEMHVHKAGCADTLRGAYKELTRAAGAYDYPACEQIEATSKRQITELVWSDQLAEQDEDGWTWEQYAEEITFYPCVDLPWEDSQPDTSNEPTTRQYLVWPLHHYDQRVTVVEAISAGDAIDQAIAATRAASHRDDRPERLAWVAKPITSEENDR